MTKYLIENLNAPGQYLSCHGDNYAEHGQSLKIWDNPHSPVTQWYIYKVGDNKYNIANVYNKKCVNVSRHDKFNGAAIFVWDNPDKELAAWQINKKPARDDKGEYYLIESCYTPTHALNVSGNLTKAGTPVILFNNRDTWSTQWRITKVGGGEFTGTEWAQPHIHAALKSKAFNPLVAGTNLGKKYLIESRNAPGKYLSTTGVPVGGAHIAEAANLVIMDNPTSAESQFHILPSGENQVILINAATKKTVNVSRHNRRSGSPIVQYDNPYSPETQFRIHKREKDAYTIESIYSGGKYLHTGEEKTNGTKVYLWDNAWIWSTHWMITEVAGGARL